MKDIDRMVISAYTDGEVEAPWKDKVSQRIATDPEWTAEASTQTRVKAALVASPEPDFSESVSRVRSRIEVITARPRATRWSLAPWAVAAAAALFVVAAGGGYWLGRQGVPGPTDIVEIQVQVPKQLELKLTGEGQLMMASTLQGSGR